MSEKPSREDVLAGVRGMKPQYAFHFQKMLWRDRIARLLHGMADRILPVTYPSIGGQMLQFVPRGTNLGRPVYNVFSQRGRMLMGHVEWSNQWGRPKFRPSADAVFDKQCIAEIYACMRDMK